MPKLIILDRDGVINQDSPNYIRSADEWLPIEGSLEAIARLNAADYRVVIATNQSGLGRGYFDIEALNSMHHKLRQLVAQHGGQIDSIFVCPHHPEEDCDCRKPKAGMFRDILYRYNIEQASRVVAVGDSLRDLEAAASAGCQPWLVRTGNGKKTQQHPDFDPQTPISDNLAAMVDRFLASEGVATA